MHQVNELCTDRGGGGRVVCELLHLKSTPSGGDSDIFLPRRHYSPGRLVNGAITTTWKIWEQLPPRALGTLRYYPLFSIIEKYSTLIPDNEANEAITGDAVCRISWVRHVFWRRQTSGSFLSPAPHNLWGIRQDRKRRKGKTRTDPRYKSSRSRTSFSIR